MECLVDVFEFVFVFDNFRSIDFNLEIFVNDGVVIIFNCVNSVVMRLYFWIVLGNWVVVLFIFSFLFKYVKLCSNLVICFW